MIRTVVFAALMLLAPAGTVFAGESQDKAKAQLDAVAYAFFQGEIKDTYPDHVKLYAIASATVEKASSVPYCPLRTAQCGMNPTCNHPKQTVTTVDLKVGAPLFKVGDGELPKAFTNYALFSGGDFKAGDAVQVSLYVYANSPSNVSKIRKVEAAAAPDKTPTGTSKASPDTKPAPDAKPKEVAILQQWQGLYPVVLLNQLPEGQREAGTGFVADAKTFATLWKAWKGEEKAPAIDFQKNIVVFTRNVQYLNMIRIGGIMLKGGVVDVVAMETMSAIPIEDKLHMSAAVIAREGVKAIQTGDKTVAVPAAALEKAPAKAAETRGKVELDLSQVDDDGLRGPPDGKVAVSYEFSIPNTDGSKAEVKAIDATVEFMPGSKGRVGAGKDQCLCIGNTHQKDYRQVLGKLASLSYVGRIIECHFE